MLCMIINSLYVLQKTGDAILTQIGVCLDESMKVTDCPTPTNTNGCDNSPIYYPTTSHY